MEQRYAVFKDGNRHAFDHVFAGSNGAEELPGASTMKLSDESLVLLYPSYKPPTLYTVIAQN